MAKSFLPWEYSADGRRVRVAGRPTPNPKKLTGGRLGAVSGVNKWKSPFGAWCEICRVAEEDFVDNKFTIAGKIIEPKLLEWCKSELSPYIASPNEWFDTDRKLYDHFPDEDIFGGQWDGLVLESAGGEPIGLLEAKTSSRPQDWIDGVPDSYALQGLAYAALMGLERVFFPVALLNPEDYKKPEDFVCDESNTVLYEINTETHLVGGKDIHTHLAEALAWWERHVVTGISPAFEEKRDKVYLDIMRKNEITCDDLATLVERVAQVEAQIESLTRAEVKPLERELKGLKSNLKSAMMERFTPQDTAVSAYGWKVTKKTTDTIDKEALAEDNLLDKYTRTEESYTLSKEKNNGNSQR